MKFFFRYASSQYEQILTENFKLLKRAQSYNHKHTRKIFSYFVVSALNL